MPYRKILADNLVAFRKAEKISQQEISFRTEVSIYTISLIERERTNVRLDILEKIASYTGLTIPELLTENSVGMQMNKIETIEEKLRYRVPMTVKEIMVWQNGCTFPICPRCDIPIDREYQSFCSGCGQMLQWGGFSKVKTRRT